MPTLTSSSTTSPPDQTLRHDHGVRHACVDIPDDLAAECERQAPDLSWSELISQSLSYALEAAKGNGKPPGIEHGITYASETQASCVCGWSTRRLDADDLEEAIDRHTMVIAIAVCR
jgi:hypothetical protein